MFKIVADNYLGRADSEEVSCTTIGFRRNTEGTQSQSCIHECFTRILRSSKGNEGTYENTQPASEYGYSEFEGKKDSSIAAKNDSENTYEPIERGKSDRQPYTTIHGPVIKTADLRKPLNPQYVNIEGKTKTNPDENIALRSIVKPKLIQNT
ncbi:Hypothetical predicted protein [Mytilus galloprovincialis]|uniref:Uncharacterized protein n=1 Tax=Mytilus galloprovincialis TaxID=29158 RepID=A0A8B6C5K9_MYTGA|nr:Hypothetical predicted protein [Mytilus galloprovincialis]